MKTKAEKSQKKKRSLLIRLALVLFAGYIIVMLVQLQMQINEKQATIDNLNAQIRETSEENGILENKVSNPSDVLDEKAREQGYVRGNEDVYIEVNR